MMLSHKTRRCRNAGALHKQKSLSTVLKQSGMIGVSQEFGLQVINCSKPVPLEMLGRPSTPDWWSGVLLLVTMH